MIKLTTLVLASKGFQFHINLIWLSTSLQQNSGKRETGKQTTWLTPVRFALCVSSEHSERVWGRFSFCLSVVGVCLGQKNAINQSESKLSKVDNQIIKKAPQSGGWLRGKGFYGFCLGGRTWRSMFWLISYRFRQVCQQINENKKFHQGLNPVDHRFCPPKCLSIRSQFSSQKAWFTNETYRPKIGLSLTRSSFYTFVALRSTTPKSVTTDDSPTVGAFKAVQLLRFQQLIQPLWFNHVKFAINVHNS